MLVTAPTVMYALSASDMHLFSASLRVHYTVTTPRKFLPFKRTGTRDLAASPMTRRLFRDHLVASLLTWRRQYA